MFEKATRAKFRFDTPKGLLTSEDLWDLPLTSTVAGKANLDDIARGLHKQLNNGEDVSFVHTERKSDPTIQLKFDLVKHVIDVKVAENQTALEARQKAEKKQVLLAALADRENDAIKQMTPEEIKKALAEL